MIDKSLLRLAIGPNRHMAVLATKQLIKGGVILKASICDRSQNKVNIQLKNT